MITQLTEPIVNYRFSYYHLLPVSACTRAKRLECEQRCALGRDPMPDCKLVKIKQPSSSIVSGTNALGVILDTFTTDTGAIANTNILFSIGRIRSAVVPVGLAHYVRC